MKRPAAAMLAALLLAARADADVTKPFVLYGDESVASTDDARALFVNPAALGFRYPSELLLAYADRQQGAGRTTTAAPPDTAALDARAPGSNARQDLVRYLDIRVHVPPRR